jgi:hypothetical protein
MRFGSYRWISGSATGLVGRLVSRAAEKCHDGHGARIATRLPAPFAISSALCVVIVASAAVAPSLAGPTSPAASDGLAANGMLMSALRTRIDGSRENYAVAMLNNGAVLIVGGFNGHVLNTAELYDPGTGRLMTTRGHMVDRREAATATRLDSGEVLIAGGRGGCCRSGPSGLPSYTLASAELYEPTTQTFHCIGGEHDYPNGAKDCSEVMVAPRDHQSATLLRNGTVLLTGGHDSRKEAQALDDPSVRPVLKSAEIYNPASGRFRPTRGEMHFAREGHTEILLKTGKVLVTGGSGEFGEATGEPPELYDPKTEVFRVLATPIKR